MHIWAAAVGKSSCTSCTEWAQRMMALDGTQPTFRQSPPIIHSSIRATLAPTPALPAAATRPPVPAPMTTRLYLQAKRHSCKQAVLDQMAASKEYSEIALRLPFAVDGMQPTSRQSPPMAHDSIRATFAPTSGLPATAIKPPAPAPMTTKIAPAANY